MYCEAHEPPTPSPGTGLTMCFEINGGQSLSCQIASWKEREGKKNIHTSLDSCSGTSGK